MLKIGRRGAVDPFIVMEVMRDANRREAQGENILHLEVGQPSTPAPRAVIAAAKAALDSERIGYTDALGLPALRAAISRHYRDFYGADVPPERIVVTTGSSGGFLLAFLASFDPGDRVALASPGYPCYRNILRVLGIEPVLLPMTAASKFQPTVTALSRYDGPRLDGLIVASPSNPVGAVVPPDGLAGLVQLCTAGGIRLISDEIYHGITFGTPAATVAALDEQAIIVNSFSKYFSMTGWRLGWLVLPPALVQPVERLAQNLFISPPGLSQYAAIAAFEAHDELQQNVRRYAANREILLNGLPAAGFDRLIATDGAFYVYADVGALTEDSIGFARRILTETGIAVTPGVDFDPARGHHFLRFSFAGATDDMIEAVHRLKSWRR
ncbi:MAG: aminotransferase class I/II-fold pyridoxal phosphate-dependent enzyme [Dongiaceae bacterium]